VNNLEHMEKAPRSGQGGFKENRSIGNSDGDINFHGERIQKLVEKIEALPYPAAKELLQECMEAMLAFYGIGLGRILNIVNYIRSTWRPACGVRSIKFAPTLPAMAETSS